jgi:hypothetical protein
VLLQLHFSFLSVCFASSSPRSSEYIHGDFLLSWLRLIRHTWTATWDPSSEPQGHIAKLILNQRVTICGIPVPGTSLDSNIDQVGPALVQLIFPTPFGKVAVIETITPICHTLQRAQNVLYAEKTVPRFLSKVFLMGLVVQFERDLPIWNYKHFLRKPLILKEDGPILKYRRWMRQFYSDPQVGGHDSGKQPETRRACECRN